MVSVTLAAVGPATHYISEAGGIQIQMCVLLFNVLQTQKKYVN